MLTQTIPTAGARITLRGEDFLIHQVDRYAPGRYRLSGEGISELVRGQYYTFDTALDNYDLLEPENTILVADTDRGYRKTKLHLETQLRNAHATSPGITVANRAAIDLALYQLTPTTKALQLPRARILIADGVGLGKTIEVGILLAELIKRGRGKRILVLALKSILAQFQEEIWSRFSIPLMRLDSVGIGRINAEIPANKNPFDYYDRTIISIDTLKNNGRFQHYLEQTRWDVIVIDECHTVANFGSQRGRLADLLSRQCDSLLLTSATPHNGKRQNFANLMTMLEPTAVPRDLEFDRQTIDKYFVRRFKDDIADSSVQANFRERAVVATYTELQAAEEAFLEWQQQLKQREIAAGIAIHQFFSIILFKAYLSSPLAARATLENRLDKLSEHINHPEIAESEENDLDNSESEYDELEKGLALVKTVLRSGADSKLAAFVTLLKGLGWRGKKKDERIVVFAERIATLEYLEDNLTRIFKLKKGAIVRFDGSLSDVDQQRVIKDFGTRDSPVRLFLTSDAGAQGVNLHYFCHRMVNYDLPWSIITLDQRNGRIDRYGQQETPFIHYLLAKSDTDGLATDLHILDRIREKEEEVKHTLGTVGTVLELYDATLEHAHTSEALVSGNTGFLDTPAREPDPDALDLEAFFAEIMEEDAENAPQTVMDLLDPAVSFYPDDFSYYRELLNYLRDEGAIDPEQVVIRENELLEVAATPELRYVLRDLPDGAKPAKGDLFRLTTDRALMQRSITEARGEADSWTRYQLLYDLHPLAKFWMTKLESRIEKGRAPVARVSQLPAGERSYVFHGQVTNKLGRSILSDFFVVTLNPGGAVDRKPEPLSQFLAARALTEELAVQQVSEHDLAQLQDGLELAIGFGRDLYMHQQQTELRQKMKRQQTVYREELTRWARGGDGELALDHDDSHLGSASMLNEHSQFMENMTSLAEERPFLRVVAVFFG